MEKVGTQTLIHAGVELVVVGGVTFWLNKKISSLSDEVKSLKEKILQYENIVNQQEQLLLRHDSMLKHILQIPDDQHTLPPQQRGTQNPPQQNNPPQQQNHPQSRNLPQQHPSQQNNPSQTQNPPQSRNPPQSPNPQLRENKNVPQPPSDEDKEVSGSELDKLLGDELDSLNKSKKKTRRQKKVRRAQTSYRKKRSDDDNFLDVECNDDVCYINNDPSKKKS